MAFDGIFTNYIVRNLNNELNGGRIDKIYQVDTFDLLINIRAKGKNHRLFISSNPNNSRIHLTDEKFENPEKPLNFSVLLDEINGVIS